MKRLLFSVLMLLSTLIITGQKSKMTVSDNSEYRQLLINAEIDFNNGRYLNCINLLSAIIDTCNLSRIDTEQALELISKAYVEAGYPGRADSYIYRLLREFPHYDLKEEENSESFNRLVKKYDIHPLFSLGVRNGGDWIRYKYIKVYSLLEGLNYDVPFVYTSGWAVSMYYGLAEVEFVRNRSLNAEFIFFNGYWNRKFFEEPSFNMSYWENTFYLEFPVYYKQYFNIYKNFLCYGAAGITWQRVLSASGNASISYTKDDVITGMNQDFSSETLDIDMINMRNPNSFGALFETGFLYKLKNVRLNVYMRYMSGFNSFTNTDKRYDNKELTDVYYYVDSKMRMTQFELGASIYYTFINSVEKKKR